MWNKFIDNIRKSLCRKLCNSRCFMNSITPAEAKEMIKFDDNIILLDVRSISEHNEKNIPGSIVIPLYELYKKAEDILIDKSMPIIIYCKSGKRSERAVSMLEGMGYENVYSVEGGIEEWY